MGNNGSTIVGLMLGVVLLVGFIIAASNDSTDSSSGSYTGRSRSWAAEQLERQNRQNKIISSPPRTLSITERELLQQLSTQNSNYPSRPQRHSESPEDAYSNGYDEGYQAGLEDGQNGLSYGYSYDDSSDYYNHYETRYIEGYEEGYEEGYNYGKASYDEEQEEEDW